MISLQDTVYRICSWHLPQYWDHSFLPLLRKMCIGIRTWKLCGKCKSLWGFKAPAWLWPEALGEFLPWGFFLGSVLSKQPKPCRDCQLAWAQPAAVRWNLAVLLSSCSRSTFILADVWNNLVALREESHLFSAVMVSRSPAVNRTGRREVKCAL